MSEAQRLVEWLTQGSAANFLIGVLALIFGTQKILSAKNVEESLGGLALPFRWLRRRRDEAAQEEAAAEIELQELQADQYNYILHITRWVYDLRIWAAANGLVLPPPDYQTFVEWRDTYGYRATHAKKEEPDTDKADNDKT